MIDKLLTRFGQSKGEAQSYIVAGSDLAYQYICEYLRKPRGPITSRSMLYLDNLKLPVYLADDLPKNTVIFCAGTKTQVFEIDKTKLLEFEKSIKSGAQD